VPLNRDPEIYSKIASDDLSGSRQDIEAMPLAKVTRESVLPLDGEVNPEWRNQIDQFCEKVIRPLTKGEPGRTLSSKNWKELKGRFAAYREWRQSKPQTAVENLGIHRIRTLLDSDLRGKIEALLEEDAKQAPELKAIFWLPFPSHLWHIVSAAAKIRSTSFTSQRSFLTETHPI
jgi:hypothetical protein